jgi:hypothetical protein
LEGLNIDFNEFAKKKLAPYDPCKEPAVSINEVDDEEVPQRRAKRGQQRSQMNFARDSFTSSSDSDRRPAKKSASFLSKREGNLLKKSSKSTFGVSVWQKRYFVLTKGKLMVYKSPKEYKSDDPRDLKSPSKIIDMSHATSVAFHYSHNAPVKSKKLFSMKNLEESRFDIYTATRVYMFKSETNDIKESSCWVSALKEAVDFLA